MEYTGEDGDAPAEVEAKTLATEASGVEFKQGDSAVITSKLKKVVLYGKRGGEKGLETAC